MSNGHPEEQAQGQWANAQPGISYDEWNQTHHPRDFTRNGVSQHLEPSRSPDTVRDSIHDQNGDPLKLKKWSTRPGDHVEHIGAHGEAGGAPLSHHSTTTSSEGLHFTRTHLGLHPIAPIAEEHDMAPYSSLWWSKVRLALREPFAEFFGVMILVLFGDGSVAQVLLSKGQISAPGGNGYGAYNAISWGWG